MVTDRDVIGLSEEKLGGRETRAVGHRFDGFATDASPKPDSARGVGWTKARQAAGGFVSEIDAGG